MITHADTQISVRARLEALLRTRATTVLVQPFVTDPTNHRYLMLRTRLFGTEGTPGYVQVSERASDQAGDYEPVATFASVAAAVWFVVTYYDILPAHLPALSREEEGTP